MQLYGSYTSPYVRHCRIALIETGLAHDLVNIDYQQSQELSPSAKVPFARDGDLLLTDSSSIIKYIRDRSGEEWLPDIRDFDLYLLASTALDSAVNLFLLERDGVTPESSTYLKRQQQRIEACLQHLDGLIAQADYSGREPFSDGKLRLGCFLSWGLFRQRINIDRHAALQGLLNDLDKYQAFARTHPSLAPDSQ